MAQWLQRNNYNGNILTRLPYAIDCATPHHTKGQCGDFKPKGCHHTGTTSLRSQQSTTGIQTHHRPFGDPTCPNCGEGQHTLEHWLIECPALADLPGYISLGPQMYLWTSSLLNQPSLSCWQRSLCEAPLACMSTHDNNNSHTTYAVSEALVTLDEFGENVYSAFYSQLFHRRLHCH